MDLSYDIVTCVGPKNADYAKLAIEGLLEYSNPAAIFVLAPTRVIERMTHLDRYPEAVRFVDEDSVIPGLGIKNVRDFFSGHGFPPTLGNWYFQQFIKMGFAQNPKARDRYVIWDSDTILLKPITFFEGERALITNGEKYIHVPYRVFVEKALGIHAEYSMSYIAQQIPVFTAVMREILEGFSRAGSDGDRWYENVFALIEQEMLPGKTAYSDMLCFSEYEIYGNYLRERHPELYTLRDLPWLREAECVHRFPRARDLSRLSREYCYAAFETLYPRGRLCGFLFSGWLTAKNSAKKMLGKNGKG
jgi:hypothetical protein